MTRQHRVMAASVALAMLSSGCFGSFNLTRKLYNWNGQVSQDKWLKEIVFIAFVWVPVYGVVALGDAILFNSVEFWSGKNPIEITRH